MEQIPETIDQGFSIFLFCMSIIILFHCYSNYNNLLITVKDYQSQDVIYEQYDENKSEAVSKGEVIATLLGQIEYDIEIDGVLISKIDNTKDNISTYGISHEKYLRNYVYDNSNNITRIVFTGI